MKARRIYSVPFEIVPKKSFRSANRLISQIVPAVAALAIVSGKPLFAQDTNEINQLKQQLREIRENFERAQNEQRQQIEALTKKLRDAVRFLRARKFY